MTLVKAKRHFKPFLTALAVLGLLFSGPSVNGEDTSPANTEKPTLAEFLPGKRVVIPMPVPEGQEPPPEINMQLLLQFEKNGNIAVGVVINGKAMQPPFSKQLVLTYKVDKQSVTILKNGKADGGVVFATANPEKGDKVTLTQKGAEKKFTLKIVSVSMASPLKDAPAGGLFGPGPKKAPELKNDNTD
tara:strand:+ start:908 stop:1471 length:564 start_codon:yes stop_codon:yes gene_type:complete